MRIAVVLPFVFAAVTTAAQAPTPTAPTAGAAGATSPRPPSQSTPSNIGTIRGRVVRADNGQPLALVRVALEYGPEAAISDANGRFELKGLPAGTYKVTASKSGYVTTYFGQRGYEGGRPIELAAGQTVSGIDFSLLKGGAISGTVVDDFGEPLIGARVTLLRQRYVNGERRLIPDLSGVRVGTGGSSAVDTTDDLGQFRLFGLMPGTYYLAASAASSASGPSRSGTSVDSDASLYPGTLSLANASAISIAAGEEITGLSFPLLPVKTATIRGTVQMSDGQVGQRTALIIQQESDLGGRRRLPVQRQRDGSFALANLPPGRYTLFARDGALAALEKVALDGIDVVVPLTLSPGRTSRGRVVLDTGAPLSSLGTGVVVGFIAANDTPVEPTRTDVRTDGTFEASGLIGRHRLIASAASPTPIAWTMKSVRRNGLDITDTPFDFDKDDLIGVEVTLTQQKTSVTGRVSDSRGRPAPAVTVVMFVEDPRKWMPGSRFIRATRPDQNGRFAFEGLPPAEYVAVAVEFLESGEETNPETLSRLSGTGTHVTLGEGEARALELKAVALP